LHRQEITLTDALEITFEQLFGAYVMLTKFDMQMLDVDLSRFNADCFMNIHAFV